MYTELSYVNACLGTMGEAPVSDLTIPHPYVPAAVAILARHNKFVQSKRWWFNTTRVTLVPVSEDVTASLPAGAIGVLGIQGQPLVLNADGTVYDHVLGENITTDTEVFVYREVAFESLPPEANNFVGLSALSEFQESYDGDSGRAASIGRRLEMARRDLNAQNTRMMKSNILARPSTAYSMRGVRGDRPFHP